MSSLLGTKRERNLVERHRMKEGAREEIKEGERKREKIIPDSGKTLSSFEYADAIELIPPGDDVTEASREGSRGGNFGGATGMLAAIAVLLLD